VGYVNDYDIFTIIHSLNQLAMASSSPSAPKRITWIIGLVCGILGIVGHYASVAYLSEYNYVLLLVGFILLAIGTTFREM
jgi:hypothetical protein